MEVFEFLAELALEKAKTQDQRILTHIVKRIGRGESGIDLAGHILADYPPTAVIMVSGIDDPEVREIEEMHRMLAESAGDIIWTMDFDGRFTYISPSAEKILGYAPAELQSLRLEQFLTPASYLRVMETIQAGLLSYREGENTNTAPVTEELEFVHRSGSTLRCDVRAGFLRDEEGHPAGVVGITRDIEDRKRAEEAAQRENAKLSAMISGMDEGVIFADASDTIIEVNEFFCELVGKTREDILGKPIKDFHSKTLQDRLMTHLSEFRKNPGSEPLVKQRPLGGRK